MHVVNGKCTITHERLGTIVRGIMAEKEKHKFKRRGTLDVQFYWNFVLYHVMAYYGSNHNQ